MPDAETKLAADAPETLRAALAHMQRSAFLNLIGLHVVEVADRSATLELLVADALLQSLGVLHGGVTGALIDTALGAAVLGATEGRSASVSVEFKVNFYRPARPGDLLTARAELLHVGRLTSAGHCTVTNQRGDLIAHGTGTYMRVSTTLEPQPATR